MSSRLLFTGVVTLAVTSASLLAWRARTSPPPRPSSPRISTAVSVAPTPDRLASMDLDAIGEIVSQRASLTPIAYVEALIRLHDPTSRGPLVAAYGDWAADPGAQPVRATILSFLAGQSPGHDDPRATVTLLIALAASDSTPVEEDPLWAPLQEHVVRLWEEKETRRWGRDQMLMAGNERSRRLLAKTLMDHGTKSLDAQERSDFTADLVEVYCQTADAGLRMEILAGIHPFGGRSLARTLADPEADVGEDLGEREAAVRLESEQSAPVTERSGT